MRRSVLFWSLMNFGCLHQVKFGILDTLELGGQSFQQVNFFVMLKLKFLRGFVGSQSDPSCKLDDFKGERQ